MINIRLAIEDDKEDWNKMLLESPEATYAHTWEWSEILADCFNVEPLRLVAEDCDGNIIGTYSGFLSTISNGKYLKFLRKTLQIFYSPYDLTWDYGGPCSSCNEMNNKDIVEKLYRTMEKCAKLKGAMSLKVSPADISKSMDYFDLNNYRKSERLTSLIDLTKDEDELFGSLFKDIKKGLKKSRKYDVRIQEESVDGISKVYDVLKKTHDDKNIFFPEFDFFKKCHCKFFRGSTIKFYSANLDGNVIGGSICFCFNDVCTERYRGSLQNYRKYYPDNALVWNAIVDAKSNGYKIFDFGGIPSDKSNGIYFYKSRWAGEIVHKDWFIKDLKWRKLRKIKRLIQSNLL